jgi:transposase
LVGTNFIGLLFSALRERSDEMTKSKKEIQRETILYFWQQGVRKAPKIHSLTNIPLRTIYNNIKKIKKTGGVQYRNNNGRPSKITTSDSRKIGQFIRRDPTISAGMIAKKLSETGTKVSRVTVTRYLQKKGYKNSLPLATPLLTTIQKENRIVWARSHINDDWKRTFFTDETAFQLFRNTVKHWYKGSRPIRPIPKDRKKIFVWGGFCIKKKTSLTCFRNIMDGKFYVEIIKNHIPEMNGLFGTRWRFQQDNDPKHTCHIARDFLKENVPVILDWPSNSPDINPIENLWGIVKRHVEIRKPKNLEELECYLKEEWEKISDDVLISLVASMKRRCELIIEMNTT